MRSLTAKSIFVLTILSLAFLAIPLSTDLFVARANVSIAAGPLHLGPSVIADRPPIPPPDFITLFQVVELILVVAYLMAVRRHPFRLGLALAVLASATMGFMIDAAFRALRPNALYARPTTRLEWLAASATTSAIAASALGNLLLRNPRRAYVPATSLLVGGATGILIGPILGRCDLRVIALGGGDLVTRRFSVSELAYLVAVACTSFLYGRGRAAGWLDRWLSGAIERGRRQLQIVEEYHDRVRVGPVEVVDLAWEKTLLGSGLQVERVGRSYVGVPTLGEARAKVEALERRRSTLLSASRRAIAILVGGFFLSAFLP